MRRKLFTLASAVSLLLCLATVVLWVRSHGRAREKSWGVGAMRWTLRAENGIVGLFWPPDRASDERGAEAEVARLLKAGNFKWSLRRWRSHTVLVQFESDGWEQWSAAGALTPGVTRSMLRALEDQDTFAEAHLALASRCKTDKPVAIEDRSDGACMATIDGLRVKLWPGRGIQFDRLQSTLYPATPEIDGGQLPGIRAQWHRRLDLDRGAIIPIAPIVAALAIMPFMYSMRIVQSRRRFARGCCPTCGYKLTGNISGACPECGSPIPKAPEPKSPRPA